MTVRIEPLLFEIESLFSLQVKFTTWSFSIFTTWNIGKFPPFFSTSPPSSPPPPQYDSYGGASENAPFKTKFSPELVGGRGGGCPWPSFGIKERWWKWALPQWLFINLHNTCSSWLKWLVFFGDNRLLRDQALDSNTAALTMKNPDSKVHSVYSNTQKKTIFC